MGLKYYLRGLGVGIVVTALIMGISTSVSSKEKLSDDEIRERAKELGMVEESTVLSDTFAQGSVNSSMGDVEVEPELLLPSENDEGEGTQSEEEVLPSPEEDDEENSPEASMMPEEIEEDDEQTSMHSAGEETSAEASEPTQTPEPVQAATASPTPVPTATPEPTATPTPESTPEPVVETQQSESVTIEIASGDSSFAVCKKLAEAGLVESAVEYDAFLCQNGYDKKIRAGSVEIPVGAGTEEIAQIILRLK